MKESAPMGTVNSSDGTTIAYDRLGDGPPVVVVGGQLCDRALTAPTAEELAKRFTVFNYYRRQRRQRRHHAVRGRARDRRHRRADRRGRREGVGVRPFVRLRPRPSRGGGGPADRQARPTRASLQPRRRGPPARHTGGSQSHRDSAGRGPSRRRGRVFLLVRRNAAGDGRGDAPYSKVGGDRGDGAYDGLRLRADGRHRKGRHGANLAGRVRCETLVLVGGASPEWMIDVARQLAEAVPNSQYRVLEGQEHVVPPELLAPVLTEFLVS